GVLLTIFLEIYKIYTSIQLEPLPPPGEGAQRAEGGILNIPSFFSRNTNIPNNIHYTNHISQHFIILKS
ncbi:MAG: hypothetical protein ACYC0J_06505, partial [Gammaproteobacteria bacterium]